ncbi:hypothetical protein GCM10027612_74580 [Microbispora bryophytorum subsp. camponoti]
MATRQAAMIRHCRARKATIPSDRPAHRLWMMPAVSLRSRSIAADAACSAGRNRRGASRTSPSRTRPRTAAARSQYSAVATTATRTRIETAPAQPALVTVGLVVSPAISRHTIPTAGRMNRNSEFQMPVTSV